MIRIEREIEFVVPLWARKVDEPKRVVSVEVSDNASLIEVAVRLRQLEELAKTIESLCPYCFASVGHFHNIDCPYALDDQLELCRQEAIREGMRS